MTLSTEDGQLYYELWLPLLDYVNKKYSVKTSIKNLSNADALNPNDLREIADKLWDDVSLIDKYLTKYSDDIPDEHKNIIRGWKRRIRGKFILERHLKKGSIFISMDDEQVYQVSGIMSSWEEMFFYASMPVVMEATFMPFKDVIISDGILIPYNINIGRNMSSSFKDIYMTAKKNGMLRKEL